MMKLVSVNVGLPREVTWKGQRITTGIFKEPVEGRVMMRSLNLDGDRQADLSVHGGADKAVYAHPVEHYDYWRENLPGMERPWGMFGENLTTHGLREDAVHSGDRFLIGSDEVRVTQPRMPCYKLAAKFGRDDIIRRFLESGRSGFYFKVMQEGKVGAGDRIEPVHQDIHRVTVTDIVRLYTRATSDREWLGRVLQVEALPQGWRDYFWRRMKKLDP